MINPRCKSSQGRYCQYACKCRCRRSSLSRRIHKVARASIIAARLFHSLPLLLYYQPTLNPFLALSLSLSHTPSCYISTVKAPRRAGTGTGTGFPWRQSVVARGIWDRSLTKVRLETVSPYYFIYFSALVPSSIYLSAPGAADQQDACRRSLPVLRLQFSVGWLFSLPDYDLVTFRIMSW